MMLARDAIKNIMRDERVTQVDLAKMAGIPGQSTISESLRRDMRVSTFVRFANALGYKVYVRERKPADIFADKMEYEVTDGLEDVIGNG